MIRYKINTIILTSLYMYNQIKDSLDIEILDMI